MNRPLIALMIPLVFMAGCRYSETGSVEHSGNGILPNSEDAKITKMITESDAIEIATKTLEAKYNKPLPPWQVTVARDGDRYVVTFVNDKLPPGVFGATFHFKVLVNQSSGEVVGILVP